jgi:hypothetical protein
VARLFPALFQRLGLFQQGHVFSISVFKNNAVRFQFHKIFSFLSFSSVAKDRLPVHWIRRCFDPMFVISARAMAAELFESSLKLC